MAESQTSRLKKTGWSEAVFAALFQSGIQATRAERQEGGHNADTERIAEHGGRNKGRGACPIGERAYGVWCADCCEVQLINVNRKM